jgi:hypothetical protein
MRNTGKRFAGRAGVGKRKWYMRSQVLWIEALCVDRKGAVQATEETQAMMDCLHTLPVKGQDTLLHDPGR